MCPDDASFWLDPPNLMDQLPGDLKPGDEGDIVVPVIPRELMEKLSQAAFLFDRSERAPVLLEELTDALLSNAHELRKLKYELTARGDVRRLRLLEAVMDDLAVMLRQCLRLRDALDR